jgi:hypothetical protein
MRFPHHLHVVLGKLSVLVVRSPVFEPGLGVNGACHVNVIRFNVIRFKRLR